MNIVSSVLIVKLYPGIISKLLVNNLENMHQMYMIQRGILHTATFRGRQGCVLRPDRAILSGQF